MLVVGFVVGWGAIWKRFGALAASGPKRHFPETGSMHARDDNDAHTYAMVVLGSFLLFMSIVVELDVAYVDRTSLEVLSNATCVEADGTHFRIEIGMGRARDGWKMGAS